jgi:membrane peptidoglycan carboxypeptidase
MANSYATLAAHGLRCNTRAVVEIRSSEGEAVEGPREARCEQTVDPEVADTATAVLARVITSGTGYPNAYKIGRPAAGKTGTTDSFSAAWFVGYTPQMSSAVVVADPIAPVDHPLRRVEIGGRTWVHVYGGDLPALIWGDTMRAALEDQPRMTLPEPDRRTMAGTKGGILSQSPNQPPPGTTPDPSASPGTTTTPPTGQNPSPLPPVTRPTFAPLPPVGGAPMPGGGPGQQGQ